MRSLVVAAVAIALGTFADVTEEVAAQANVAAACRYEKCDGAICEVAPLSGSSALAETDAESDHGYEDMDENDGACQRTDADKEDKKDDRPPFLGHDRHEDCSTWAQSVDDETGLGLCEHDRPFMLSECPESCLDVAGINVGTLTEEQLVLVAEQGYGFIIGKEYDSGDEGECADAHEECEEWAEEGECLENPDFMLDECQKSCMVCFEPGVRSFRIGVTQRIEFYDSDEIRDQVIEVLRQTLHYMVDEVMADEKFIGVRRDCFNYEEKCSYWASQGECDGYDEAWMAQYCSPACRSCLSVEFWHRCSLDPEVHKDIVKKGDLNAMFERIMEGEEYAKYSPVALSRPYHLGEKNGETASEQREGLDITGPWIIRLDTFLSDEESDDLISLSQNLEFELSTEISDTEKNDDGTYKDDVVSEGRTSTNAWCSDECYDVPLAKRIRERIVNLTGVPEEYSENFQFLKYEPGQFYEEHHDYITHQQHLPGGPRILTVFMYLNDVEEGGETVFLSLNLTIAPKKGAALIWPSVLDEDPEEMDDRTYHMAMPVKKGLKFGANAWLHLRDYRAASEIDCI